MQKFRTLDLSIRFYERVKKVRLPPHHQIQLLRAASSIALNLSEGNAKISMKEKTRYYLISLGSLRECQTIFRMEGITDPELLDLADHLGASLYKLSRLSAA